MATTIPVGAPRGGTANLGVQPRVLLIYPPVRLTALPRYPPFGLMYLAAVLQRAGMHVEILDINLHRQPFDAVLGEISRRRFDVIGIGGMTTVYYYMKLLSLELKERYPMVPIIGGGSACSASPEVVLKHTSIDVCCIGEGEPIIVELVERLISNRDLSDVPGIAFRDAAGEIRRTADRPRMLNIEELPYPAYDSVDMLTYSRNNAKVYTDRPEVRERIKALGISPDRAARPMTLFTKRGCPFGCNFCYRNFGRKVAFSSVQHTLDHMRYLEEKYDTCHFVFNDEIFNVRKDWVMEFCGRLIAEDRRYILGANNGFRANVLDEEMVIALKKAGFCQLGIGIESFYDPTLKAMQKGQSADQIYAAIRWTKKHGLQINSAQLLFGYATDGPESMKSNVAALKELGFQSANFSIPCPYPGTYLYDEAKAKDLIGDEEEWLLALADRDITERVINLSGMTDAELRRLIRSGLDELRLYHLAQHRPVAAAVIGRLQPFFRDRLGIDAHAALESTWRRIHADGQGTSHTIGQKIADIFGPDPDEDCNSVSGTKLRDEVLQRLETRKNKRFEARIKEGGLEAFTQAG